MNDKFNCDAEIRHTLEAYRAAHDSEHAVVAALRARGISELRAEKLVALVPLAFGRILIAQMAQQPTFAKAAMLKSEDGDMIPCDLQAEPIFSRALQLATEMYHRGERELFAPAASASAELAAANNLLKKRVSLAGIAFTEPYFLRLSFEDWLRQEP